MSLRVLRKLKKTSDVEKLKDLKISNEDDNKEEEDEEEVQETSYVNKFHFVS